MTPREIKFRAWLPETKQMGLVVSLEGSNKEYKFFCVVVEVFPEGRQVFYKTSDFILMQFTGLHDKNGVADAMLAEREKNENL